MRGRFGLDERSRTLTPGPSPVLRQAQAGEGGRLASATNLERMEDQRVRGAVQGCGGEELGRRGAAAAIGVELIDARRAARIGIGGGEEKLIVEGRHRDRASIAPGRNEGGT